MGELPPRRGTGTRGASPPRLSVGLAKMSGFSGLDFMAKALENAQKQADQMLGIDEHAAKEAMEESASEAQIFKAVAGDAS